MTSRDHKRSLDNLSPVTIDSAPTEPSGPDRSNACAHLRERAEKVTRQKSSDLPVTLGHLSEIEIEHTLHELQVHQVELQMQNEDLRQTQGELEAARAHYFDFYDSAPVGYCTLNVDGRILEANLTAANLLGFDRAELLMQPLSQYVHKEYRDSYYLHSKELFRTGEAQSCELKMVEKNGAVFWADLKSIAVKDTGSAPICRVVLSNITERKLAEEALRDLGNYNRSLIEANLDALVTIKPDGKISDVNSATEQVTGYLRHDLIGTDFSDYFTEPERARQGYLQVFKEGVVRDFPLEIRHRDGRVTTVLYNATTYHDDAGNISGVFASARDITIRRQVEAALRETNAMLSLFMKYSPVYTFIKEVTENESKVLMASENFQDMLGISGSAMTGMTMEQLFPAELASKMTADDWAVVSAGKKLTLDEQLNGRCYTTIKFPVFLGNRNLLAGYTIDITERKLAEEEMAKIEAMNRQLQKAESLSRMAGAIAHHFNNKLHVVMGHLELMKEDLARGKTPMRNLTAALSATDKAAEVSRMMLTYLGQVNGDMGSLDLSRVCQKILTVLRASMPGNVVLATDLPLPGPVIKADVKQIQQILTNLITNAWEAARDEQQCTVSLLVKTTNPVEISSNHRYPVNWQPEDIPYACMEVRDNGSGISAKDLEEVFSPFFTTKFTGRGLGLPMVLGLAQAHGGVVTVESSPGQGSIFRVFLPTTAEEVPIPPELFEKPVESKESGKVLLVDDDEIVLDVTSMMLSKLGFSVIPARDGLEAVEVFRRHKQEIRLVLSDMAMPRMNGWETLITLRQMAPNIPVILASGYSEDQVMEGNHFERPQAFLGKPYSLEALRDAVRRALESTIEKQDPQSQGHGEIQ